MASRLSTRTLQIAHNVLVRAIRQAERDDLVGRNVAALVKPPKGQHGGRPSKSLTLEQAVALMAAAKGTRLEAYIVLSLLSGLRTEEARALRWDHVVAWVDGQWQPVSEAGFDHEQLAVFVWRADRAGGDTKTPRSRRTLALPRKCVEALREHRVRQAADRLAAGPLWKDHGLVFASAVGTPLDDHNVRRQFRVITEAAGLGRTWVPRELRHTFVSLLSAHGVPVEAIALLAGHNQTATTELVYRHQIVPALTRGAEVMDQIFGLAKRPAGVTGTPGVRPSSRFSRLRTSATTSARCHLMITDGGFELAVRSAAGTAIAEGKPSRSAGRAAAEHRKWRGSRSDTDISRAPVRPGRRLALPSRGGRCKPLFLVMVSGRHRRQSAIGNENVVVNAID